jgi:hypothetical protein
MAYWKALIFVLLVLPSATFAQNAVINSYRFGIPCNNLLSNGDIESGVVGAWWSYSDGDATLSVTTSNPYAGTYCLQYHITTAGSNVQVSQNGFGVTSGVTYKVSFYAKASASRGIIMAILQNGAPYNNLGLEVFPTLTTSWQLFEYTFQANASETDVRWYMGLGGEDVDGDDFYFDNLSICAQ